MIFNIKFFFLGQNLKIPSSIMQIVVFFCISSEMSKNDQLLVLETFPPVNKVGI